MEYQNKMDSFTILRITVFCILPLILQSDPSYQMLTWSLSLRHWLLQWYVSKALSILFHTVVPVLSSPWCTMHSSLKLMPYHLPYQVRHQCQKHHENSWSLPPSQFFYFWLFTFKKHSNSNCWILTTQTSFVYIYSLATNSVAIHCLL